MKRTKTKPPVGALTLGEARTHKGPWYIVHDTGLDDGEGYLEKREKACPGTSWFAFNGKEPQLGWCFSNYWFAYAYSLKVKANAGHRADRSGDLQEVQS